VVQAQGRGVDGIRMGGVCAGARERGRAGGIIRLAVAVWLVCVYVAGFAGGATAVEQCPNEALRVGPSANLPDCRAYELVTPENLGRTEDMAFENGQDHALASSDGEHLALEAKGAFVEPGVSDYGTSAVFSRTPEGWTMKSATAPGMAGEKFELKLFSPDLSQVAFRTYGALNPTNGTFEVGSIGGPYSTVASVPQEGDGTEFLGANDGTASVPAFSDVLLQSQDHALLPAGQERKRAEETTAGADDLYDWAGGHLQLVNVGSDGGLLDRCGATLGDGYEDGNTVNAISADSSKIFFTSPQLSPPPGCDEPSRLYMRVDGRETVEVSAPEGVRIEPSERQEVRYDGAIADGSKVFFTTETALTRGASAGSPNLYEYDTEAPEGQRLTLVASGVLVLPRINPAVVVSEDGSTIYYETGNLEIFRYEMATGRKSLVATATETALEHETSYTTPDGGFLVFAAGPKGVNVPGPHGLEELEVRGVGHNELYRYDAADGGVICVSCGEDVAPAKGEMSEPKPSSTLIGSPDGLRSVISMSEDGRRVFFQSTAQLVPQDTNAGAAEEAEDAFGKAAAVYEWEAEGTEEAPGVFCDVANGCTHLISSGEDAGPELFLGASADGRNVFFTSAARLVPQATSEFTNIYDARVDGGFLPPTPTPECMTCQGVGSSQLQLNTPPSEALAATGNPAPGPPPKKAVVSCAKGRKLVRGKCVKTRGKHKAKAKKDSRGDRRGRS
jgi:hypothetical protein